MMKVRNIDSNVLIQGIPGGMESTKTLIVNIYISRIAIDAIFSLLNSSSYNKHICDLQNLSSYYSSKVIEPQSLEGQLIWNRVVVSL